MQLKLNIFSVWKYKNVKVIKKNHLVKLQYQFLNISELTCQKKLKKISKIILIIFI